jgi:hypothetical protein
VSAKQTRGLPRGYEILLRFDVDLQGEIVEDSTESSDKSGRFDVIEVWALMYTSVSRGLGVYM